MLDHSKITLGELLSSINAIIRRNALSILKQLSKHSKGSKQAHNGRQQQ